MNRWKTGLNRQLLYSDANNVCEFRGRKMRIAIHLRKVRYQDRQTLNSPV